MCGCAVVHGHLIKDSCPFLSVQVDPFDKNSPIKQAAIEKFPPDMFFVLRVVQLLRGMANGGWLVCNGVNMHVRAAITFRSAVLAQCDMMIEQCVVQDPTDMLCSVKVLRKLLPAIVWMQGWVLLTSAQQISGPHWRAKPSPRPRRKTGRGNGSCGTGYSRCMT